MGRKQGGGARRRAEESARGARREKSAEGARERSESSRAATKTGKRERLRRSEGKKNGKVEAQEGHEGKEEMTTQEECVEAKKETNSMHEESDVSNRHMTWWRNAWWIRMDGGPHMRTARGRRRIWRAARRAAEQARDDDGVEETQSSAEEAEGEKW